MSDMVDTYQTIEDALPQKASSILDIGCGVAGIDVLLSNHYKGEVDIFLIDKTHVDSEVYYGFKKRGSFYNSLQVSENLLKVNGIASNRIHVWEATKDNRITFEVGFDVIISLISWGFHYPITTYLDGAYGKLRPGGVLIVDVRRNTGGEEEIGNKFGNCEIVA